MQPGAKLLGVVLLIATAVGFEIENPWVFLAGAILGLGWIGWVLTAEHSSHSAR